MTGLEFARRLREGLADRPLFLVAVTGVGSDEARRRTTDAGLGLHLTKPTDGVLLADPLTAFWRANFPREL